MIPFLVLLNNLAMSFIKGSTLILDNPSIFCHLNVQDVAQERPMESSKDTSSVAEQLVDRLRGMRPESMFDVENPPFLGRKCDFDGI